jgi:hypothetical protein
MEQNILNEPPPTIKGPQFAKPLFDKPTILPTIQRKPIKTQIKWNETKRYDPFEAIEKITFIDPNEKKSPYPKPNEKYDLTQDLPIPPELKNKSWRPQHKDAPREWIDIKRSKNSFVKKYIEKVRPPKPPDPWLEVLRKVHVRDPDIMALFHKLLGNIYEYRYKKEEPKPPFIKNRHKKMIL